MIKNALVWLKSESWQREMIKEVRVRLASLELKNKQGRVGRVFQLKSEKNSEKT